MARPRAAELTSRELAVMQVFWRQNDATAEDVRECLAEAGETLAYVTVANVVRGLAEKGFLKQIHQQRPFRFKAVRSFEDVSKRLVGDLMTRLFEGSREAMLVHLLNQRRLTAEEKAYLTEILNRQED